MKKNFKIVLYIKNLFTFVYAIMQNTKTRIMKNDKKYGAMGFLNGKKVLIVTHHYSIKDARINAEKLGLVEPKTFRMRMNCGGSQNEGFYDLETSYYTDVKNAQIYAY